MKNISTSSSSLNLDTNNRNLAKDLVIDKKSELRKDTNIVIDVNRSVAFTKTSHIIGYAVECSNWLYKNMSNNLAKSITNKLKGYALVPLDNVVRISVYFFKLRSSRDAIRKLDKIKENFSDIAFVKLGDNKKRLKTLEELQKERKKLLLEISNIKNDMIVKSYKISQINRDLSQMPIHTNFKLQRIQRMLAKKTFKLNKSLENLAKQLKIKESELHRLSEYSLLLELKMSNNKKIIKNGIILVHSLVSFTVNSTVFVLSSLAAITINPFIAMSSNILWWNDKIFHYSEIGQMVGKYFKNQYLNDIKARRACILLKKIDDLQQQQFLSYSKLGNKALEKSHIDLLEQHIVLPADIRNILSNIGKTFITCNQVNSLSTFLDRIHTYDSDDINEFISDIKKRLSDYRKHISPIITSRLGEKSVSNAKISSLSILGVPKDIEDLLKGVSYRFITPEEVGNLDAFFKEVKLKLEHYDKPLSDVDTKNINYLINYFTEHIDNYKNSFIYKNVDLNKIINDNDMFSVYWLVLKAKSKNRHKLILKNSWFSQARKGKFHSRSYSYSLKVFDYIDKKLVSSKLLQTKLFDELFTVRNEEWGRVWKLFHPFGTNDIREQARKDNSKFLLDLIKNTDTNFIHKSANGERINWNNPDEVNKAYEKYSRCEHICDYLNALAAGNSKMSRGKLFRSLHNRINNPKDCSADDALYIIQTEL